MAKAFNINQLEDVIFKLLKDRGTRQATIVYIDPLRDSALRQTKDRACNVSSLFLVRDGRLSLTQTVRSNDIIWGLPYNLIQFTTIQEVIASFLGLELGDYHHMANSLHLYEKHVEEARRISPFDIFKHFSPYKVELPTRVREGKDPRKLTQFFWEFAGHERAIRNGFVLSNDYIYDLKLPLYWEDMLKVFLSYYFWKNKQTANALAIARTIEGVFYPLLMKNYFQWRIRRLGSAKVIEFRESILQDISFRKKFVEATETNGVPHSSLLDLINWITEGEVVEE